MLTLLIQNAQAVGVHSRFNNKSQFKYLEGGKGKEKDTQRVGPTGVQICTTIWSDLRDWSEKAKTSGAAAVEIQLNLLSGAGSISARISNHRLSFSLIDGEFSSCHPIAV